MDNTRKTILIGLMIFAALATSTSAITWLPQTSKSQEVTTTANETIAAAPDVPEQATQPDSFANVEVVQDPDTVVIVVSKVGEDIPDQPIIVVPPSPGNENGSIIMPPSQNETLQPPDNVTIIEPGGNITEIPGNVTIIGDNETAIITDGNQSITQTPGNVTVIDPPLPEPCGCPPAGNATAPGNETAAPIPPVTIIPAPGQNVTQGTPEEPQVPSEGNVTETPPAANATEPAPPVEVPAPGNETTGAEPIAPEGPAPEVNITGNVSTTEPLPPTTNITGNVTAEEEPPQATQLPASLPQQQSQPPLFWINYDK